MHNSTTQQNKDFWTWHTLKSRIHAKEREVLFHAQEVWWCSLGANVGVEADGKHTLFERPVIIFRKLNSDMFWGLPLTSKEKQSQAFYFRLFLLGKNQIVLLSQMRVLSSKRLIRRLTKLSDTEFLSLNTKMLAYINKTDPLRGPQVPNGNNEQSIAGAEDTSISSGVEKEKAPSGDGTPQGSSSS